MQRCFRPEFRKLQRSSKDLGVRFVSADLAGDENVREKFRDPEVLKNHSQSSVEVGNDGKLKSRAQLFQNLDDFRVKLPNAGFGEVFVSDLKKIISVQFVQIGRNLIKDFVDDFAPPIFVVV